MNQLTIHSLDDDLAKRIRQFANQERISLNKAVLRLIRRGTRRESRTVGTGTVGSSLDDLIGTWTHEEALEMERALRDLSRINRGLRK